MNTTFIISRDITVRELVFSPASLHSQKATELQRTDIHDDCTAPAIMSNVCYAFPLCLFMLLAFRLPLHAVLYDTFTLNYNSNSLQFPQSYLFTSYTAHY